MTELLHIADAREWEAAKRSGSYQPESLRSEGFIHLSQPEQLHLPANAIYSGTPDLVLLWIDPTRLTAEIRNEPPHPQAMTTFPHLYGPLDTDAVVAEAPLAPWKRGEFQLPPRPIADAATPECRVCELNAQAEDLPMWERLYLDAHWRVAHAWSSLPGWLVIGLRRHAEALDQLTPEEAASLGALLQSASVALKQVVGCEKTYVILFAEQPLYRHLHLHVVPRMAWFTDDEKSTNVLRFLNVPEEKQVPVSERERLAAEIGRSIHGLLGDGKV